MRLLFTVDSSKYILIYRVKEKMEFSKLTFNTVHFFKEEVLNTFCSRRT